MRGSINLKDFLFVKDSENVKNFAEVLDICVLINEFRQPGVGGVRNVKSLLFKFRVGRGV